MPLDLTLAPLYRINGQEVASLPGLLIQTPPQNAARVRAQDKLVLYLLLTGNAVFSLSEYMQVAQNAANVFFQAAGSLTNALRAATEHINAALLQRNMSTSAQGQYVNGWLTLAALRDAQCTFLISGPMHIYWFGQDETRHIYDSASAGKGLGTSQSSSIYYSQVPLHAGDRMLFYGRAPAAWDAALNDAHPSSLDAMRRRLSTVTKDDLNSVLIQATDGTGILNLLKGNEIPETEPEPTPQDVISKLPHINEAESTPEPLDPPQDSTEDDSPVPQTETFDSAADFASHVVQPSAYAIPPQQDGLPEQLSSDHPLASLPSSSTTRDFPASIPRIQNSTPRLGPNEGGEIPVGAMAEDKAGINLPAAVFPEAPTGAEPVRAPSPRTRQTARILASGIQSTRRLSERVGERFSNFIPRLLPNTGSAQNPASASMMFFIAVLIPLMVVTLASVVYLRYGRSEQYDTYLRQAQNMRDQAVNLSNPIEERNAWQNVLLNVEIAESHRKTSETAKLQQEAEGNLDQLLGITRLQFNAAFSSKPGIEISRMAASENELFLLNAANGEVLRAVPTGGGRGFQLDTAFNCRPGVYGSYTVGPLVDIAALPGLNSLNATMLGIDASGNLLYCGAGQIGQATPLPPPDTNWGRVTGFWLDNGNLYVLDAPSRAVWVYNGKDGTYVDSPYFFFGEQTPAQDVIDFVVSGDELSMLHADGHVSTCSYSRNDSNSQCQDPLPFVNPFAAYQDTDLFGTSHFTQMLFAAPPDQSILLLDADAQGIMRFAPHSLELQNQFHPTTGSANPIPGGPISAVTVSPNHVIYVAVAAQVYFALNMP